MNTQATLLTEAVLWPRTAKHQVGWAGEVLRGQTRAMAPEVGGRRESLLHSGSGQWFWEGTSAEGKALNAKLWSFQFS